MGIRNLRAICPNCGGKIHTQPKGLGHLTWANSWFLVETGKECQHCGATLTGKVKAGNRAELAPQRGESGSSTRPRRTRLNGVEVEWIDGGWQPVTDDTQQEPSGDTVEQLRQLEKLRHSGVLTEEEFRRMKSRLLG